MADRLSRAQVDSVHLGVHYVAMAADQPASYSLSFCPVPFPVISHSLPIPVPISFPSCSLYFPSCSLAFPSHCLPFLFSSLPFALSSLPFFPFLLAPFPSLDLI